MRPRPLALGLSAVIVVLGFAQQASAQLLRRASGTVRTGSSHTSGGSSGGGSRSVSSGHGGGGWNRGGLGWSGRRWGYLPYPYAYGLYGQSAPEGTPGAETRFRALTSLEGGLTIPSVVRGAAGIRLLFPVYELEVRYGVYHEPGAAEQSTAALGRWDFGLRFVDQAEGQLRFHGGLVHWADSNGSVLGFSGGIGVELFPSQPVVLSLDAGGGSLGEAGLLYARITAGVMLRNVEAYAGWDHVSLVTRDGSPWVNLTGPVAGLRFWL